MAHLKRFLVAGLVMVVLIGGTGVNYSPALAAGCVQYHIVSYGESLSWIGRYYGVSWLSLASINGISAPYVIYPGQKICINSGGGSVTSQGWSYAVTGVVKDTSVTIQTLNFPDNVLFEVYLGKKSGGTVNWTKVSDLDSGRGGKFKATFSIPGTLAGTSQLYIRLTQTKKNVSLDRYFSNISYKSGTGGLYNPWYYGGIPTIWITGVVRNSTVTITTNNFPAGLDFDVLMGPMGTRGVGGYYVTTFNSGSGGTMTKTFNIPPELAGSYRIAIRTQNLWSGYYSYNWFYNNTTP